MAIDFTSLQEALIETIRYGIGSDLTQTDNPDDPPNTWGIVQVARAYGAHRSDNIPIPEYPYVIIDRLTVEDDDGYLSDVQYDEDNGGIQYTTVKIVTYQVSVLGGRTLELCQKLKSSYRLPAQIYTLRRAGIGLKDISTVSSSPQYYDTGFIEQAQILIEVRVNDVFLDTSDDGNPIEQVIASGELNHVPDDPDPVTISLDVDSTP